MQELGEQAPPTDEPPKPQATAEATELRDAIQEPIDKAKAVEDTVQEAADKQQAEGGIPAGALIWLAFLFFFIILPMLRGRGRRYQRAPQHKAAPGSLLERVGCRRRRRLDTQKRRAG